MVSMIEIENSENGSWGRKIEIEKWEEMVGDENGKVGVNEVRGGFEWEEQSQLGRGWPTSLVPPGVTRLGEQVQV